MTYIILSTDWQRPVYFCTHQGSGFTLSTDPKKAQVFDNKKLAELARAVFSEASGMSCEIKRL